MRLTITRDQLQQGLQRVLPATAAKPTLPVLSYVLLEATEQGLRLFGTDLDVTVGTSVPASVDATGVIVVPAKRLMEIVKELPSGSVKLTSKGAKGLQIDCHRSRFTLKNLGVQEFPTPPAVAFRSWMVAAGALKNLIARVSYAASREESRPVLNGVLWELSTQRMRMVATDGHRMAIMDAPVDGGEGRTQAPNVIVPPRALKLIGHLFAADEMVEIGVTENHLGFRTQTTQLVTRLIEGPYPAYKTMVPKSLPITATIDRASFVASLRRMAVIASSETHKVRLDFQVGTLTFTVQTPDLGEAEEPLSITYTGKPLVIEFNARYLLEMLDTIPTDEVRLQLDASEKPIVCTPVDWDDDAELTAVVVPLRIGEVPAPRPKDPEEVEQEVEA